MGELHWGVSDDGKFLTVDFPTDPPSRLELDAAGVDTMLAMLRELRAGMTPTHPIDFAMGQKVVAQVDPVWVSEPELLNGDSLLHIRDTGFGWLHYVLPSLDAAKLAGFLAEQAETKPAAPDKVN